MNYCSECGRGYEESCFAQFCEFLDSGEVFDWPYSQLRMERSVHALQKAVRSIAAEEPREILRLTDRYRAVRDGSEERVEYLSNDNAWVPTANKSIDEAVLSALHVSPSHFVCERGDDTKIERR